MATTIKLAAEARNEFGKGAARRIRRDHKVPAVIYGRGHDPIHITLPGHDSMLALRQSNALIEVQFADGSSKLVLPKQIVRHPVTNNILHIDLLLVVKGEKVSVQVPVVLEGDAESGALVNHERNEITVLADPTSIPSEIVVSVEGAKIGEHVLVGDIKLPKGAELDDDAEALVVAINVAESVTEMLGDSDGAETADDPEAAAE